MYKVSTYMLLPLILINHTVSESNWILFGIKLGAILYAVTIVLALYVGLRSQYRGLITTMIVLAIVMRLLAALGGTESLREVGFAALAIVFAVAGAMMYGRNPFLLHKQLVIYLAICIPIMLLQILGVSSLLMGWNMGYLDDYDLGMTLDEFGTFREVPLYPTLFVGIDDLVYSVGQGRPVGLMYGSNPLSIFVSIAIAINLAIPRTSRIRFSDIVVTGAVVLTAGRLVYGTTILLYLWFLIFGVRERRLLVLKLIIVFAIVLLLYYILFPGLFIANFSKEMMMVSIMLRLVDLLRAVGLYNFFDSTGQLSALAFDYKPSFVYEVHEGYSSVATLIRSKLLIPSLFVIIAGSILYVYRVRNMISRPAMVYVVTLMACVLTQFGVPFVKAGSFQLIMGFALFPLFKKMWAPMVRPKIEQDIYK